jgi:Domain of unknown function (DUF4440)
MRVQVEIANTFMKLPAEMLFRVIIALLIFPMLAPGQERLMPDRRDKGAVLRVEHTWLRASQERDRATLDRILSDDFIDSNWKGERRTKQQVLADLSKPRSYSQRLRSVSVTLYGDTAIARGLNVISDPRGLVVMRLSFTDVLRYRQGRWQAVAAQETPVSPR